MMTDYDYLSPEYLKRTAEALALKINNPIEKLERILNGGNDEADEEN